MRTSSSIALALAIVGGVLAHAATPPCPGSATVTICAENLSLGSVDVFLDGHLIDEAATCTGGDAARYPDTGEDTVILHVAGARACVDVAGRRPGAWVHRLHVVVPSGDPDVADSAQDQAQQSVVVAGAPNVVDWTVYRRTFVVANTNADTSDGSLRAQLQAAADFTAAAGTTALVTFSRDAFPGTILLGRNPCAVDPTAPYAAVCFDGSHVVVDGLDAEARPGAVTLSVGDADASVLRVYGSDDVFRGLVLDGSTNPALTFQRDTVALTGKVGGPIARRDRVEQCIVRGPTMGDAVSVDGGAGLPECRPCNPLDCPCTDGITPDDPATCCNADDVVVDSELTRARDRGLKVATFASAALVGSCVHDNVDGGVLATGGAHLRTSENLIQHNRVEGDPTSGQKNGLTVLPGTDAEDPTNRSLLTSQGDVIRFNGGRGVSVTNDASGTLSDVYVAQNALRGAVVDRNRSMASDAPDMAPEAHFHGVALVCNGRKDDSDPTNHGAVTFAPTCTSCSTDPADPPCTCLADPACDALGLCVDTPANACTPVTCYHRAPVADWGDDHPGLNAFTSNHVDDLDVEGVTSAVPALGNQWGACPNGSPCDPSGDIAAPPGLVETGAPDGIADPHAVDGFVLTSVSPTRPHAGDVVRVYGQVFNAIGGNPPANHCDDAPAACATDSDCATGPCSAQGTCACGVDTANDLVRTWNVFNGGANRIRILAADGKTVLLPASFPQAVTPTMLAFRMPWDCFAPVCLEITKKVQGRYVGTTIPLCDAAGCPSTTTTTTSTSTSSIPSTTSTSTSTTSTTLPCDRDPCGSLDCDVASCMRPKLARRAAVLASRLCATCPAPHVGKLRRTDRRFNHRLQRLVKVLRRCGVPCDARFVRATPTP